MIKITWPAPSTAIVTSPYLGRSGLLENSGNESCLQLNEVYVFGFAFGLVDGFGFADAI